MSGPEPIDPKPFWNEFSLALAYCPFVPDHQIGLAKHRHRLRLAHGSIPEGSYYLAAQRTASIFPFFRSRLSHLRGIVRAWRQSARVRGQTSSVLPERPVCQASSLHSILSCSSHLSAWHFWCVTPFSSSSKKGALPSVGYAHVHARHRVQILDTACLGLKSFRKLTPTNLRRLLGLGFPSLFLKSVLFLQLREHGPELKFRGFAS